MDLITFVRDYWPVICGVGFVVAWCSKLQAQVNYLSKDQEGQKQSLNAKIDGLQLAMNSLIAVVAKMEGKLESQKDH